MPQVVAQTALAGMLALARHLPQLMEAQRRQRRWAPLIGAACRATWPARPRVVVGWGPIGQGIGAPAAAPLGLRIAVARSSDAPAGAGVATARYDGCIDRLLPRADWLLLACPLSRANARA